MGSNAFKTVINLHVGKSRSGTNHVHAFRMPADDCFNSVKCTVASHKHFTSAAFFRGATEQGNGSFPCFKNVLLHRKCCRQGTCRKQIVSATVRCVLPLDGFFFGNPGNLTEPFQRIVFSENSHAGRSGSKRCFESSRDANKIFRNLKTLLLQNRCNALYCIKFLKTELGMVP